MLAYSPYSRHTFCLATSGAAGAGGEADRGADGAPKANGAPAADGSTSVIDAMALKVLLGCLMSADETDASEAAATLIRLNAENNVAGAVAAAADLPQLLRLLLFSSAAVEDDEHDEGLDYPGQYCDLQDEQRSSVLEELAARAAGDCAVCEAIVAEPGALELIMNSAEDHFTTHEASEVLEALVRTGGERCRAAMLAEGLLPRLVQSLKWDALETSSAASLLDSIATAGNDADRDALLAAGAVPLLVEQLSGRYGESPRASAASAVLRSVSALRSLATTTDRARGRLPEVRAAGVVAALIGLLEETVPPIKWWLNWSDNILSAAVAALLALGEEHLREGGAAAGPFLSAEEAEALSRMATGNTPYTFKQEGGVAPTCKGEEYAEFKEFDKGEGGEEGEEGDFEATMERAAVGALLLERLA